MDNYFEWKENLKENMQEVANRTLEQIQEDTILSEVKNRHEGYGISAEHYIIMQKSFKSTRKTSRPTQRYYCARFLLAQQSRSCLFVA